MKRATKKSSPVRKAVVTALATALVAARNVREKVGHAILGDTPEKKKPEDGK